MRGWLSVLTRERDLKRYQSGVFVTTSTPDVTRFVIRELARYFPAVSFTIIAPESYGDLLPAGEEKIWLEQVKARPVRLLAWLRRRRFDLCVFVADGQPIFRKAKLSAFVLNAHRTVIFNGQGDYVLLDRRRLGTLASHFVLRFRLRPLLVPLGIVYLVVRTLCLRTRAQKAMVE